MKAVKLFEQFVNESQGSQFSHAVLTALEPTIIEMVENIKAHIIEQYAKRDQQYAISEYEAQMIRLGLIVDMLKSFEKYTEPTDKLIEIQATVARKGISINAVIERDGQQYMYYTEAIGAGGYNIQAYHYRYLTKTKLPNAKVKGTLADEYAQQLKKLSKAEKINADIKMAEKRIEMHEEQIQSALGFTDEEIYAKYLAGDNVVGSKMYDMPDWKEIVKRGADKNYDYDEAKYNQSKAEYIANTIAFWKRKNITWKQDTIKSSHAEIKKLTAKLQQITSQS
jgi:hypothetical protein